MTNEMNRKIGSSLNPSISRGGFVKTLGIGMAGVGAAMGGLSGIAGAQSVPNPSGGGPEYAMGNPFYLTFEDPETGYLAAIFARNPYDLSDFPLVSHALIDLPNSEPYFTLPLGFAPFAFGDQATAAGRVPVVVWKKLSSLPLPLPPHVIVALALISTIAKKFEGTPGITLAASPPYPPTYILDRPAPGTPESNYTPMNWNYMKYKLVAELTLQELREGTLNLYPKTLVFPILPGAHVGRTFMLIEYAPFPDPFIPLQGFVCATGDVAARISYTTVNAEAPSLEIAANGVMNNGSTLYVSFAGQAKLLTDFGGYIVKCVCNDQPLISVLEGYQSKLEVRLQ